MSRAAAPLATVVLVAAAALVAACDAGRAASPSSGPAGGSDALASAGAPSGAPTSFGPPPSPTPPDDTSPIALDPTLLEFLPASIEGAPLKEDLDVAAEALLDPSLPQIATGVDAAVAVDAGNSNLVSAWVVRVRPEAFGDEAYRQWRESYDEGACTAGGGIVGTAEADVGGRQIYITTCVSAFRTYHVWLKEQDVVISASSIGAERFGEKLMEGLRVAP